MEALSTLIKVTIPKYFQSVPIPSTIGGFASLGGSQWLQLLSFFGVTSFVLYSTVKALLPDRKPKKVNPEIKKDNPKVVDLVEIEDLDKDKVSYCRCWRSSKFPLCDGSHNKFNEDSGDNVGPLVIKKKTKN